MFVWRIEWCARVGERNGFDWGREGCGYGWGEGEELGDVGLGYFGCYARVRVPEYGHFCVEAGCQRGEGGLRTWNGTVGGTYGDGLDPVFLGPCESHVLRFPKRHCEDQTKSANRFPFWVRAIKRTLLLDEHLRWQVLRPDLTLVDLRRRSLK